MRFSVRVLSSGMDSELSLVKSNLLAVRQRVREVVRENHLFEVRTLCPFLVALFVLFFF